MGEKKLNDKDLIHRQQLEIELLRAQLKENQALQQQKLKDTQSFYEELIALLPGHVFWLNTENIFLGCNNEQALSAGLGSRHDIVGKTNFDMPWMEQAAELNRINNLVMDSGKAQIHEEYAVTVNGAGTYLSHKVPLRDASYKIVGLLGVSLDITQQKELEKNLRDAKAQAELANQAKTEFLANMQHDIRTPLTGIVGFAQILMHEANDLRIKDYAENLVASSHALLELMDEVLEAVRVSSGEIPILKRKFSLKDTMQQISNLYSAKAHEKSIDLSLDFDDTMIPKYVIGDKIRIHRIALELVGNALNFTDRGFVRMKIELARRQERHLVIKLIIEDSGIGIPKDKQAEIYVQFKRLTPSYNGIYKGAGLGLYVTKQFIDELEGEIYVESELHKGTRFTCIIPLTEPLLDDELGLDVTLEQQAAEKAYLSPISHPLASKPKIDEENVLQLPQVLVVEDNAIAQKVAKTLISSLECVVQVANDGHEAIKYATEKKYDLIFMDIGLGDELLDGYEVTRQIRSSSILNKSTSIIALTAHGGDSNKKRCIESGMDVILNKPLTYEHAINIIQSFIPSRMLPAPTSPKPLGIDLPNSIEELFQLEEFSFFDEEEAIKNCGDLTLLNEMLMLLITKEVPPDVLKMQEAFAVNNFEIIEKIAHKIKGGAVYVGTVRMKMACQYVERYWKTGEKELFIPLYEQMVHVIQDTIAFINNYLKHI